MEEKLIEYLKNRKNLKINLLELQNIFSGEVDYINFAKVIKLLEEKEILIPINKNGMNKKAIPLYNSYKIKKIYFKSQLANKIESLILILNENIKLESYYSYSEEELDKDIFWIKKVSEYLNLNGFPLEGASSEERSYALVEDEKWIEYKGGKKILSNIEILDKMKIIYNVEPLMLAINKRLYRENINHKHLVVENKATFYDLLEDIENSPFTSLVFGSGWKIVGNINLLDKQLGLKNLRNDVYYFGDLDNEGISIWYSLKEKKEINLATEYYSELIKKKLTKGKENQYKNETAISEFLKYFSDLEGEEILKLLKNGCYYPQESLSQKELSKIWRNLK